MLDAEATMQAFANRGNAVVMDNPQVTAPVEVTLDDIARQRAMEREANLPTAEGYAKAEVPDLRGLIIKRVELMGPAAASVYFNKTVKQVKRWIEGTADPGLEDLMLTLERPASTEDRQAAKAIEVLGRVNLEDGEIMVTPERPRMPVMICMPIKGDCSGLVMASMFAMGVKHAPFLNVQSDTLLIKARNELAHRFMQSGLPWALWLDSDCLINLGTDVFQRATGARKLGLNVLQSDILIRLLSHNLPFVGGIYASRAPGGPLVIQPDVQPRNDADRELCRSIRDGTARGVHEVAWVASGCSLVHRDVYLKVQEAFRDTENVPTNGVFPFYTPLSTEGEDMAFCRRVHEAGIKMFIDVECVLGHRGTVWHLPEGTFEGRRLA